MQSVRSISQSGSNVHNLSNFRHALSVAESARPMQKLFSGSSLRQPSTERSLSKFSVGAITAFDQQQIRTNNIRVYARFRPLNRYEQELTHNGFGDDCVRFLNESTVMLQDLNHPTFSFDRVLPPLVSQRQIFEVVARETVRDVLNGYNGTIFAYGQTGSGKTYTMVGDINDSKSKGIIPHAINEIFDHVNTEDGDINFVLTCSILEIYRENLYDLLSEHKDLKIKQSAQRGVFVQGLSEVRISTAKELYDILERGEQGRRIASTKFNENSSRSHTLFMLKVRQIMTNKEEIIGKLNLVDLAGSQKVTKTGAVGQTLEQAKKINFSLSCLGNVIHALTNKSDHIPYRDSKLTRILKESLGGNFRTSMIVTCSSHSSSLEQTISTLKFACRAKNIKLNCKINIKSTPEEMQRTINQLRSQIVQLKMQLQQGGKLQDQPDPSHEQAHQTVRDTSRLRMVKNPFKRNNSVAPVCLSEEKSCKASEKQSIIRMFDDRPSQKCNKVPEHCNIHLEEVRYRIRDLEQRYVHIKQCVSDRVLTDRTNQQNTNNDIGKLLPAQLLSLHKNILNECNNNRRLKKFYNDMVAQLLVRQSMTTLFQLERQVETIESLQPENVSLTSRSKKGLQLFTQIQHVTTQQKIESVKKEIQEVRAFGTQLQKTIENSDMKENKSPTKFICSRIEPKTPPKIKATVVRSISLCKQLLQSIEKSEKVNSLYKMTSEKPAKNILFRYDHLS